MKRRNILIVIVLSLVLWSFFLALSVERETMNKPTTYLFVQTARSGSLIPVEGKENQYTFTMKNVSPQTIYFSDRPARDVGQVPIRVFLEGFCFSENNPPNAAIEVLGKPGEDRTILVELFKPTYDPENDVLEYVVSLLEQEDHSHGEFNEERGKGFPKNLGTVTLSIDDCSDVRISCNKDNGDTCGRTTCCQCWDGWHGCNFKSDCCSNSSSPPSPSS